MIQTYTLADLRRLEKRLSNPLDIELEAWEAGRSRYTMDEGGRIYKMRRVSGGSAYSGTIMETIYATASAGAALATFTTEASQYASAQPQAILPASFFDPTYSQNGKTLRVTLRGVWSDTTAAPTFTLGFRQDSATGTLWGGTAALTANGTSQTNIVWELEFDIISQSATFAASHNEAVLVPMGFLTGLTASPSAFAFCSAFGTLAPTSTLTLTTGDASHYLVPTAACGTSNANNKWQMLQMMVFGCN